MLANNHVIEHATKITATVASTGTTYQATVVGYDQTGDIALLQLQNASGLTAVQIGNSSSVKAGNPVVLWATPRARAPSPRHPARSPTGPERHREREGGSTTAETLRGMIQTNADIVPGDSGDSGGPLASSAGVIGMDTADSDGNDQQASTGLAIPVNTALSVARQIAGGHASSTITIGCRRPSESSPAPDRTAARRRRHSSRAAALVAAPAVLHQQFRPDRALGRRAGQLRRPGQRDDLLEPGRRGRPRPAERSSPR